LLTKFEELGINSVVIKVVYFNIFSVTSIAKHVKGKDALSDFSAISMLIS
jgi:hypothetical protein